MIATLTNQPFPDWSDGAEQLHASQFGAMADVHEGAGYQLTISEEIDGELEITDTTTYPESEGWTPEVYDAALRGAGYLRTSDWDDVTCGIEDVAMCTVARA